MPFFIAGNLNLMIPYRRCQIPLRFIMIGTNINHTLYHVIRPFFSVCSLDSV